MPFSRHFLATRVPTSFTLAEEAALDGAWEPGRVAAVVLPESMLVAVTGSMNGVNSMLAERERGWHEDQQQTVSGPDLAKILPRISLLREKRKENSRNHQPLPSNVLDQPPYQLILLKRTQPRKHLLRSSVDVVEDFLLFKDVEDCYAGCAGEGVAGC
jgi:hypothetical protein